MLKSILLYVLNVGVRYTLFEGWVLLNMMILS